MASTTMDNDDNRLPIEISSECMILNSEITKNMLNIASTSDTTIEHVALTSYIIFLFKLTAGERNFSITQNKQGQSIFHHLNPHLSFSELLKHISTILTHKTENTSTDQESSLNISISLDIMLNFRTVSIQTKINSTIENENSFAANIDPKRISCNFSTLIQHDLSKNKLNCIITSSMKFLSKTTIEVFAQRFDVLCQQLFYSSFDIQNQPIYELSILLPSEHQILRKLDNNRDPVKISTCIHQAFVEQAVRYPNKLAVILDDQCLTYSELLLQSQQLALALINEKGVQPGDIVCQYLDRSIEMIIGMMSIEMAGAAYAPLNTTNPLERLRLLVEQVKPKLILVNTKSCSGVNSLNIPILDISKAAKSQSFFSNDAQIEKLSRINVTPESVSYVVFTSGSTGVPKGVSIRHHNIMAYINIHIVQSHDIVLQLTPTSFDLHIEEIFGTLVRGAQLVILKPVGHLDFDYVTQTVYDKSITFVSPVPSWLNALGKYLQENIHAQQRMKFMQYFHVAGKVSVKDVSQILSR